jgi:hypothetical protein
MVDLVGRGGHWIARSGAQPPVRAIGQPSAEMQMAKMPRARPLTRSSRWACFVFPPPAWRQEKPHPAILQMANLEDGTVLIVVRELFRDADELHRFVFVEYPRLGSCVTDPRGLLVLRAGAFLEARHARTYDEVLREHGARGGWLER